MPCFVVPIRYLTPLACCLSLPNSFPDLFDRDAQLPQVRLGQLDLPHDLLVGLGNVVEGQYAPAQAGEEVCAEGDQGPEGQDGDDLGLDDGGEGNQMEVESEVDLGGGLRG